MKPQFFRKVLKNGMTVILEKRELPVVSVAFAVRQGGINESEDEKGISHFIEHMLYKGTPTRNTQQIAEQIERNGGVLNGFTDEDVTAYWCKIPSEHLDVALNVLSDMVKNPLFDEKELEKERQVIFEEIKMYKDNPRMHVFEGIQKTLYGKPFGVPLIGTFDSMNSIDRKKIVSKFNEVYQSNNLILCVVGDADFEKLVDFCEKTFEKGKGKIEEKEIVLKNEEVIEEREGIDQANLIYGFHSPLSDDELSSAAEVLITLMAGGLSSRLFSEIREKRNLAYSIKGDVSINKKYSFSLIYVGTTKENVSTVRDLIIEEFRKVSESLSEKELEEVKRQVIGNYKLSMEDSQNQMASLLSSEIDGDAEKFYLFEDKIKNVKISDVKRLASDAVKKFSFYALVPKR